MDPSDKCRGAIFLKLFVASRLTGLCPESIFATELELGEKSW